MKGISIETRCYCNGDFEVKTAWDGPALAKIHVVSSNVWEKNTARFSFPDGKQALYLTYRGTGKPSLKSVAFEK